MNQISIYCVNIDRHLQVEGGTTLLGLAALPEVAGCLKRSPICARVNNKTESLQYTLYGPKQVEYLDDLTPSGRRVYERSLCMMLYRAVSLVNPSLRLRLEHSVSRGRYCRLFDADGNIHLPSKEEVEEIATQLRYLANADIPFLRHERPTGEVIDIFRSQGLENKALLLETTHELYTSYYTLDGLADSYYGVLAPSTALIHTFDLQPYKDGLLLLGQDAEHPGMPATPVKQEKMYRAFQSYLKFNSIVGVSNAGELNRAISRGESRDIINVSEALHSKLLGRISDEISSRNAEGGGRIVLIAGPSSSGKTTSTKKLAIQLMTNLVQPKMISLDDYFVNRDVTPRDADGDYDYESLYALDLERLNSDLRRLLAGECVNIPTYSFELGCRVERERPLQLHRNEVLLMEGIHGLNPDLIPSLRADDVFKIYVSALTTMSIDDHNWVSTTDTRLLRRMVRDAKYRHTSALDTMRRWQSVRRGEEKWIFPYQENADATFNSSLIYELAVMRSHAMPLLRNVPHDTHEYATAYRLMRLLDCFDEIDTSYLPSTSLLREFLGGSSFHY